ncbi:hypothetical protein Trydic_g17498 [Trypoxylus dichotomus]
MPANDYVFRISLCLLKLIGEYMQRTTTKILVAFRTVNIFIMFVLLIFAIGPVFQEGHKRIAKIVEAVLAVAHPLLKYMLLIHNKPYVEELLTAGDGGFWQDNHFDHNFIANERRFFQRIRTIQLVLPVSSIGAVLFFMLRPAFHINRLFLVETWIVDSLVLNALVLAFQYYLFLLMVPLIMGYDSLYLALCVHVIVQARRLKYKLEGLSADEASHHRLIFCIKYHQFLIRTFLKMKSIFSITLLFHYFVTLTSCCIELYELMENAEYDIEQVLNVFVLFCQFGYYAFPAGQVSFEFRIRRRAMEKLLDKLPEYDITDIALNLLELLGEHMYYSSKGLMAYRSLNVVIFTFLSIFIIVPMFQGENKKYVENIEALVTVVHPFFKYVLFIRNKPYIERLFVEKSKLRWNQDDFEPNFVKADSKLLKSLRIVQLFFPICFYVILSFMLRPLFAGDSHMFVVETWVVDSIVVNTIVLALEYYLLVLIIPILVGYDCLYMAFSIHIIVQLRRLNHRLNNLPLKRTTNDPHEDLFVLIRYHQLLMR